jgi:16S rRNA (uracil1498-N3)-methyltransferase
VSARRFFVEGVHAEGTSVTIEGGDAHKIVAVLRLRDGDRIDVVDSAGTMFDAVVAVAGGNVTATLAAATVEEAAPRIEVDVAQAVPKGQKMDFIVEKATELGAHAILPFYSERGVVRDSGKVERWRRLAKSAAQQSGRRHVPAVEAPLDYAALLARFHRYDLVLFPWELAGPVPLRETLPALLPGANRILIVVGPEGGFSHAEADAAAAGGARLVWLGRRILRTETAAMVLLAILEYMG